MSSYAGWSTGWLSMALGIYAITDLGRVTKAEGLVFDAKGDLAFVEKAFQ